MGLSLLLVPIAIIGSFGLLILLTGLLNFLFPLELTPYQRMLRLKYHNAQDMRDNSTRVEMNYFQEMRSNYEKRILER